MNLAPASNLIQNEILAGLTPEDFSLLQPHLEPVTLNLRQVLEPPNRSIRHNYFPVQGLASVIAIGMNGHRLEVGIIGREGMTGLPIVTDNTGRPTKPSFKVAGSGSRIASGDLRDAIANSRALHTSLLKFVHAFMNPDLAYRALQRHRHTRAALGALAAHGAGPLGRR